MDISDHLDSEAYDLNKAKKSVIKVVHEPFKVVAEGDLETLQNMIESTEKRFNPHKQRWSGFTLLHRAAGEGQTDVCAMLLDAGAKVNERTVWGWHTPLHLALGKGWDDTAKYLVQRGANIHAKNKAGEDCCEFAFNKGFRDLATEFRPIMQRLEGVRMLQEKKARAAANAKRAKEAAEAEAAAEAMAAFESLSTASETDTQNNESNSETDSNSITPSGTPKQKLKKTKKRKGSKSPKGKGRI